MATFSAFNRQFPLFEPLSSPPMVGLGLLCGIAGEGGCGDGGGLGGTTGSVACLTDFIIISVVSFTDLPISCCTCNSSRWINNTYSAAWRTFSVGAVYRFSLSFVGETSLEHESGAGILLPAYQKKIPRLWITEGAIANYEAMFPKFPPDSKRLLARSNWQMLSHPVHAVHSWWYTTVGENEKLADKKHTDKVGRLLLFQNSCGWFLTLWLFHPHFCIVHSTSYHP